MHCRKTVASEGNVVALTEHLTDKIQGSFFIDIKKEKSHTETAYNSMRHHKLAAYFGLLLYVFFSFL